MRIQCELWWRKRGRLWNWNVVQFEWNKFQFNYYYDLSLSIVCFAGAQPSVFWNQIVLVLLSSVYQCRTVFRLNCFDNTRLNDSWLHVNECQYRSQRADVSSPRGGISQHFLGSHTLVWSVSVYGSIIVQSFVFSISPTVPNTFGDGITESVIILRLGWSSCILGIVNMPLFHLIRVRA